MSDLKNKYHVAINSVGYMLRGAPGSPAYTRSVVPSQVNRLAISDLNYADFAGQGIFYLAQTDWSAGIKTESVWRDDAKYYYSTNLDTYSYQGEIRVEREVLLDETFNEDVYCGAAVTVGGVTNSYVGTYKTSGGNIKIYKNSSGTWSDIASTTFGTNQNAATYLVGHKDKLWVGTVGVGNTDCLDAYDGTSWVDHQSAIDTATGWQAKSSRAACEVGDTLYVGVEDYLNDKCAIVSTGNSGATWALVKNFGFEAMVISMCSYNGKLYYLLYLTNAAKVSFRMFDPATSLDIEIEQFNSGSSSTGTWDKLLKVYNGKIVITIVGLGVDTGKIYEYDGSEITEIFSIDTKKYNIGREAYPVLSYGCVEKDNRLYWGNLIYNGESFFNYKKPLNDVTNATLYPLFVDNANSLYYMTSISSDENLYTDSSSYKATTAKNFLVVSEMSPVVSIDKLLHSITVMFNPLVSGDEIKLEYSINNRTSWVTVNTLTYSSEGGSATKKEIIIPNSILFNKIWWRISMANTGGASTPVLLDLIMAYKPIPNYKNRWQMRFNFSDGVKLLTNANDNRQGSDMNSQLWNEKLTKKQVKFQDIDYLECTLLSTLSKTATSAAVRSVQKIPPQGRIRAVSGNVAEEMYYTSATTNKILGITRGARGTTSRQYTSGQILDNGYDVYVEDISTSLNFTDESKTESIAQVLLIES